MEKFSLCGEWSLMYAENREIKNKAFPTSIKEIEALSYPKIKAQVPGNFELDMYRVGLIPDPFCSENVWALQKLENLHLFYYRTFEYSGEEPIIHFEGLDTVCDIYINGEFAAHTENMLISHEFPINLKNGTNEIVIHITPAVIHARNYDYPVAVRFFRYNEESAYIRKAPHMYGWDIMPRAVSGGIWRPVYITENKTDCITEFFAKVMSLSIANKTARLCINYRFDAESDDCRDYSFVIKGVCGESRFEKQFNAYFIRGKEYIDISDCRFWYPRNYGDPDMYEVTLTLLRDGKPVDEKKYNIGVRTVELVRTSIIDENDNGEFCFKINGKRVFAMGTNWVPVDAYHSNDVNRLPEIMPMLNDLGCNIIRMWGGNVYEDDMLYDFCDRNGIMIWQDFTMGCAAYPQDEDFQRVMREEATAVVRRLRLHPAIILWAGDNECDSCGTEGDPNKNVITRNVFPEVIRNNDPTRPYLPSSPYYDEYAYKTDVQRVSEHHLWGPRDYFKGEFYRNSICCFASETGYHGCNSPKSLKKFISPDRLWPWYREDGTPNRDWLCHAASPEDKEDAPYLYRIKLMSDQVATLFTEMPQDLENFARASQISQAEAFKYFIERFRLSKWRRTGIIWWNLIDGWPQISDAIVDYYYQKKLAYYYIRRCQQPLCLMFDEPNASGDLTLYAVNDLQSGKSFRYTVTDVTNNRLVASGEGRVNDNVSEPVCKISSDPTKQIFYLIEWTCDGKTCKNHFMSGMPQIDFDRYIDCLKAAGFYEFGGFDK